MHRTRDRRLGGVTTLLLHYPEDATVAQIKGGRKLSEGTQHPLIFLAKAKLDEATQLANAGDSKAALTRAQKSFTLALRLSASTYFGGKPASIRSPSEKMRALIVL